MELDNEYLMKTVGDPLTKCLTELVTALPCDPIEWISHWLYKWTDNEIYFYEKSIYLKDFHRMSLQLRLAHNKHLGRGMAINKEIQGVKSQVKDDSMSQICLMKLKEMETAGQEKNKFDNQHFDISQKLARLRRSQNVPSLSTSSKSSRSTGASSRSKSRRISSRKRGHEKRDNRFWDKGDRMGDEGDRETGRWQARRLSDEEGSRPDSRTRLGDVLEGRETQIFSQMASTLGNTVWCLDCNLGLVCQHNILGDLKPPCRLVHPESPEWWATQGFSVQNLYDHEIYSTNNLH